MNLSGEAWPYSDLRDIPRTHFSSVVIQELLAGARTVRHRRQARKVVFQPRLFACQL
jgi:hypothetical protein